MVKWHLIIKQNSNSNGFTGGDVNHLVAVLKLQRFPKGIGWR